MFWNFIVNTLRYLKKNKKFIFFWKKEFKVTAFRELCLYYSIILR
jgi:hypothetical protein